MARIETEEHLNKEQLKKEIKKELPKSRGKKRRSCFGCGGCLTLLLAVILGLFLLAAGALAKSGLMEVPYLSDWLYRQPAPLHQLPREPELEENIEEVLSNRLQELLWQEISPEQADQKTIINFSLSEEELTALINKNFLSRSEEEKSAPIYLKDVQFSITGEQIELYALFGLPNFPREPVARFIFHPFLSEGILKIEPRHIFVGNLRLPVSLTSFFVKNLVEDGLNSFSRSLSQMGEIKDLSLAEGSITLKTEVLISSLKIF